MPQGAAIAGVLCALVIGLAIGTLIGAVFLRAAIALYNKMAGGASSPSGVPAPAFGKAMWISFATCVAQLVVGLFIGGVTGTGATAPGAGDKGVDVVTQLISLSVSLFIMAAILSGKLPTTFGRAILVTLCYLLIVILVVGVLVAIALVVFGVVLRGT
jgi:hypothetical protein